MRKVYRSAIVPHSAAEMFRLVDDVESYPEFLPWCQQSEVRTRADDVTEASLALQKGSVSKVFTTRNLRKPYDSIGLELLDGPFRQLSGEWRFSSLGATGCKVTLELEFEFDSKMADLMFGSFFEATCNSLVDAFTERAAAVYGAGTT